MMRSGATLVWGGVRGCTSTRTRTCVPAVRTLTRSATRFNKDGETSSRSGSGPNSVGSTSQTQETAEADLARSRSIKPLVRESSSSPEELNALPLPYLSFALGVPTPPSTAPASWAERRDRLISPEHRMASRKAIVQQATRGYFHDFHAIKSHGGKTWRAPNTLIKDERAQWFPRFEGTRLSDKQKVNTVDLFRGKVSIVALLGSKISEEHTKSFYEQSLSAYNSHPKFQLVQVGTTRRVPTRIRTQRRLVDRQLTACLLI